ncbi:MAG: hypothetical protein FJW96_11475 [Actinobacteria bacterium]|nr:hypothetical protein [Actinomycetota bacterium]
MVMSMRWAGVTPEQYEALCADVDWEDDRPDGGVLHVACFDGEGLRVIDVRESAEAFEAFVDERLMPGVARVGLAGQPEIEILPAHALYVPGFVTTRG